MSRCIPKTTSPIIHQFLARRKRAGHLRLSDRLFEEVLEQDPVCVERVPHVGFYTLRTELQTQRQEEEAESQEVAAEEHDGVLGVFQLLHRGATAAEAAAEDRSLHDR
ncbi:hypothetical protein DNTS_024153 [Danionella cerebrum]|uniref:Uncharacterized protein n=1 Tax=Danionella cerebrum TaxID=2873325 RepID=A0A553RIH1_9TELE|nr:hypothetical protein DNTS_024153 [Danionella translucida]